MTDILLKMYGIFLTSYGGNILEMFDF